MNISKTSDEILNYCKNIYGDCKDGSFEACLHYEGYYQKKKEDSFLAKVMNEFEENKSGSNTNGDLQAVGSL